MIKIIQIFIKQQFLQKKKIKPEKSLGVKNFFFVNLVIKAVILQVSNTDLSALVNITFLRLYWTYDVVCWSLFGICFTKHM